MDGWETRRRRDGGYDHCIFWLEAEGVVKGVDIDTRHFTGNHPPFASIEGFQSDSEPDDAADWTEIVPKTAIDADSHNFYEVTSALRFNYLRLNIDPDGGVARLRVHGQPRPAWQRHDPEGVYELSSIMNGERIAGYSDAHYGSPWVMLSPGRGKHMGDGWETRWRREPRKDWIVVALGARGIVERIELDTAHFKGNFPDGCSVEGALIGNGDAFHPSDDGVDWRGLMAKQKLEMDRIHAFEGDKINQIGPVSHLRLSIYPDGGVSRFRAFGRLVLGH